MRPHKTCGELSCVRHQASQNWGHGGTFTPVRSAVGVQEQLQSFCFLNFLRSDQLILPVLPSFHLFSSSSLHLHTHILVQPDTTFGRHIWGAHKEADVSLVCTGVWFLCYSGSPR